MKIMGRGPMGTVPTGDDVDPVKMFAAIQEGASALEAALEDWANRHNISEAARADFVATFSAVMLTTLERAGAIKPRGQA